MDSVKNNSLQEMCKIFIPVYSVNIDNQDYTLGESDKIYEFNKDIIKYVKKGNTYVEPINKELLHTLKRLNKIYNIYEFILDDYLDITKNFNNDEYMKYNYIFFKKTINKMIKDIRDYIYSNYYYHHYGSVNFNKKGKLNVMDLVYNLFIDNDEYTFIEVLNIVKNICINIEVKKVNTQFKYPKFTSNKNKNYIIFDLYTKMKFISKEEYEYAKELYDNYLKYISYEDVYKRCFEILSMFTSKYALDFQYIKWQ